MPRIFFSCPLMAFAVFLMSINLAQARSFNNDFETGDLTDWKMDDTENNAFEFQPTWGDNPTATESWSTFETSRGLVDRYL